MGFTYGNILKRICTMGWCVLGLCWLAYLLHRGQSVHPDAAFGDSVSFLLPPLLQGVMLACVLAAAMSTGDALQVTVAGLVSQNIYRRFLRPNADEAHYVRVTRLVGLGVIALAVLMAIAVRDSVVTSILLYFKMTATIGVSVVMGMLWRRMNAAGVFCSTIAAAGVLLYTEGHHMSQTITTGLPLAAGVAFGVIGSLLTRAPDRAVIERFYTKIHVPIGQEEKLSLPLDQAVPPSRRLISAGGLLVLKPSRQSWVGFLLALAICGMLVAIMAALLA